MDATGTPGTGTADQTGEATAQLLVSLELLPAKTKDAVTAFSTPHSLQVITAGALALSKWAVGLIAALGGSGVILAWLNDFWAGEAIPVRVAITLGLSLLLAALAIAVAAIVRADVHARATATAAQYHARARVAAAFIGAGHWWGSPGDSSAGSMAMSDRDTLLATLAPHDTLTIRGRDIPDDSVVRGVRTLSDGSVELFTSDDWIPIRRVSSFTLVRSSGGAYDPG